MKLQQLRYFCETVDAGSAAVAAERLHVAPTAISMQMSQLETELGGELFDRSRRPMELTALGRFLYPRGKEVLKATADLVEDARAVAAGRAGSLAIGYTRSSIFSILPATVRAFRETHSKVRLELVTMLSEHQPEQLLSGRIQVGIARYIEFPKAYPSLVYTPLFADRFCLAVPRPHPFSQRNEVALAELDGVPFITYPRDVQSRFAEQVLRLVRQAGAEPVVVNDALDIHTALGLVAAGLGCSLVGRSVSLASRPDIDFVKIAGFPEDTSQVFAVTAGLPDGGALARLLETLLGVGRQIECLIESRERTATA